MSIDIEAFREWLEDEAVPLLHGDAMQGDEWDMPLDEVVQAFHILHFTKDAVERRMKALRERLMEEAEAEGDKTGKEGFRLLVEGQEVLKEKRVNKLPEEDDLRVLLKEKKIDVLAAFSKQETYVIDPSKLKNLIDLGQLEKDEVEDLRKENWALKVVPSNPIAKIMRAYETAPDEEDEPPTPVPQAKKKGTAPTPPVSIKRNKKLTAAGPRKK